MTYLNTSEQFAARGNGLAATVFQTTLKIIAPVGRFFAYVGTALINASEASSRFKTIEALRAKSDVELAEMGIKRDEIAQYVFKDMMYI
jgi:hypothetical protein